MQDQRWLTLKGRARDQGLKLCSCGCILRNLTKGSLDSGSKSERGFDACQQRMNETKFAVTRRRARGICYFGEPGPNLNSESLG